MSAHTTFGVADDHDDRLGTHRPGPGTGPHRDAGRAWPKPPQRRRRTAAGRSPRHINRRVSCDRFARLACRYPCGTGAGLARAPEGDGQTTMPARTPGQCHLLAERAIMRPSGSWAGADGAGRPYPAAPPEARTGHRLRPGHGSRSPSLCTRRHRPTQWRQAGSRRAPTLSPVPSMQPCWRHGRRARDQSRPPLWSPPGAWSRTREGTAH